MSWQCLQQLGLAARPAHVLNTCLHLKGSTSHLLVPHAACTSCISLPPCLPAGPMAHPIRPESYIKMDNFYTLTVYEKGG